MNVSFACLFVGLLGASAVAQEVTVKVVPAKSSVLRYTISSKSEMTTTRKNIVNGEERAGRNAAAGAVKSTQSLVFKEGPAGTGWREYAAAEASVSRPGRDGEERTTKIAGALAEKKIVIAREGGKPVFKEAAADKVMPARMVNGLPAELDLSGLVPTKAIEVKGRYELDQRFIAALRDLLHPVQAANAGGAGRARGQGGRGQGQGGRSQGRGRGRAGANANTWNATAVRLLASSKLTTKGTGELVALKEKDGHKLAVITIEAVITGTGTPAELGMGRGGNNRRRGGRGANAAAGSGEASVSMKVRGDLVIDQTESRIESLKLTGTLDSQSESKRTANRNGEERKIVSTQSTKGTFALDVQCADLGAPQASDKAGQKVDKVEKKRAKKRIR